MHKIIFLRQAVKPLGANSSFHNLREYFLFVDTVESSEIESLVLFVVKVLSQTGHGFFMVWEYSELDILNCVGLILLITLGTKTMNKQSLWDTETLNPAILQQITASAVLLPGKTV